MFNAGFDLLGSAPVLQPLADLAMHVLEQPNQRANSGFLPFLRSCSHGSGPAACETKQRTPPYFVGVTMGSTGRVSIAIPRRQRRQNFEGYSSSHRLDRDWECAARYDSQQIDA